MKLHKFFGFLTLFIAGLFLGITLVVKIGLDNSVTALDKEEPSFLYQSSDSHVLSFEKAFVDVAEMVGPAVVSIQSERTQVVAGRQLYGPFGGREDFFNQFFKDFFGEVPKREYKSMGLGSGMIVNSQGYILTNQHVIDKADKITVTLSDGREFTAKLIGEDYRSDLAVLKIEAKDLKYVKMADRDEVKIGQWAVAIGNPFGFAVNSPEPTVTVGVISALRRHLPATEYRDRIYSDLIQTDAPINPGNSGGPLLNLKGEVIGINVAIYTTSGGYQGVGFAIPVEQASYVMDKLIKGEEVEYGWLGVQIQDLTQEMADYFGLSDRKGALVAKVLEGSPAEKSGLKEGDVIRKINGDIVDNTNNLMGKVSRQPVGSQVKCERVRDKNTLVLVVELGKRPLDITLAEPEPRDYTFRGIKIADLTEDLKRRYGVTEDTGVIISEILP
ncbi:MAG: Do family serine endopeptidase, partial [Candidatus Omnitrophica bacterium]|nr:Do family serine endopeptidase [Candidatus Omnitrophota bacterium]